MHGPLGPLSAGTPVPLLRLNKYNETQIPRRLAWVRNNTNNKVRRPKAETNHTSLNGDPRLKGKDGQPSHLSIKRSPSSSLCFSSGMRACLPLCPSARGLTDTDPVPAGVGAEQHSDRGTAPYGAGGTREQH